MHQSILLWINFYTGRNKGSPIRIFTNIDQSKITLPEEENYKFCDECNRWVCSDNEHCYKCNSCTSKVKKIKIKSCKFSHLLYMFVI